MRLSEIDGPEDLEIEVVARAYRDLRELEPLLAAILTDRRHERERAAFEAGVAAGCKATVELLNEQGEADAT